VLKSTCYTAALVACLFAVTAHPARSASAANAPADASANEQEHAPWEDDPKFIESRKVMDDDDDAVE
jgi:hypothetical protein